MASGAPVDVINLISDSEEEARPASPPGSRSSSEKGTQRSDESRSKSDASGSESESSAGAAQDSDLPASPAAQPVAPAAQPVGRIRIVRSHPLCTSRAHRYVLASPPETEAASQGRPTSPRSAAEAPSPRLQQPLAAARRARAPRQAGPVQADALRAALAEVAPDVLDYLAYLERVRPDLRECLAASPPLECLFLSTRLRYVFDAYDTALAAHVSDVSELHARLDGCMARALLPSQTFFAPVVLGWACAPRGVRDELLKHLSYAGCLRVHDAARNQPRPEVFTEAVLLDAHGAAQRSHLTRLWRCLQQLRVSDAGVVASVRRVLSRMLEAYRSRQPFDCSRVAAAVAHELWAPEYGARMQRRVAEVLSNRSSCLVLHLLPGQPRPEADSTFEVELRRIWDTMQASARPADILVFAEKFVCENGGAEAPLVGAFGAALRKLTHLAHAARAVKPLPLPAPPPPAHAAEASAPAPAWEPTGTSAPELTAHEPPLPMDEDERTEQRPAAAEAASWRSRELFGFPPQRRLMNQLGSGFSAEDLAAATDALKDSLAVRTVLLPERRAAASDTSSCVGWTPRRGAGSRLCAAPVQHIAQRRAGASCACSHDCIRTRIL